MKSFYTMIALIIAINMTVAQSIKPFLLSSESDESRDVVIEQIEGELENYSFQLLGKYTPPYAPATVVMVITSSDLRGAAKQVGGVTGVTSTWKLLVGHEAGKTKVSYPNPEYWGNAIFQQDFAQVEFSRYMAMSGKLSQLCASVGTAVEAGYGSEMGKSATDLQEAMAHPGGPSSEKSYVLTTFDNYDLAVQTIDSNLKVLDLSINELYNVEISEANTKLYGFGLRSQEEESAVSFLPENLPSGMDYLPIEVLVREGEVHMLNSYFIVPMIFPDQSVEALQGAIKYYDGFKDLILPAFAGL